MPRACAPPRGGALITVSVDESRVDEAVNIEQHGGGHYRQAGHTGFDATRQPRPGNQRWTFTAGKTGPRAVPIVAVSIV